MVSQGTPTNSSGDSKLIEASADDYFLLDTRVGVVCEDGYESEPNSTVQICTRSEHWAGEEMICRPRRCSAEDHPVIGIFVGDLQNHTDSTRKLVGTFDFSYEGNFYGNELTLRCKNNSSESELTWKCDSSGQWKFLQDNKSDSDIISRMMSSDLCELKNCNPPEVC